MPEDRVTELLSSYVERLYRAQQESWFSEALKASSLRAGATTEQVEAAEKAADERFSRMKELTERAEESDLVSR